jgi:hypothetical protein
VLRACEGSPVNKTLTLRLNLLLTSQYTRRHFEAGRLLPDVELRSRPDIAG